MTDLSTESYYLFLMKRGDQWMATTKSGRVCVVRNPFQLMDGSPLVVWDAKGSSVPAVGLLDHSDEPDAELDDGDAEPR